MKLNSALNNNPRLDQETRWLLKEKYHGILTAKAQEDIEKLKQGEHVDYVIGFVNFCGCTINLSEHPLIPRPETEYWVQDAIKRMKERHEPLRCLDLFAGSGCVGVAVLKHVPEASVDFADNDKHYLTQIQLNATLNAINKQRYRIIQSDLFSKVEGKYDYILANPPYLATTRKRDVQASVLKNEPANALFAGSNGLDIIRKFLAQAKDHLTEQGIVYLEFDTFQKNEIAKLLSEYGCSDWKFFKDQFNNWRYTIVK